MKSTVSKRPSDERLYVASQWQLFRWKLARHRLAMVSMVVLGIFYLAALCAEFVAPYDPNEFNKDLVLAPILRPRFIDDAGKLHLRPFVYRLEKSVNENWQITYVEDRSVRYRIRFLVHGDPYKLWGFIPGDLHLFGTDKGVFSPLGRDRGGRDLFSRIVFSSRVSLTIGLLGVALSLLIGSFLVGYRATTEAGSISSSSVSSRRCNRYRRFRCGWACGRRCRIIGRSLPPISRSW